MSSSIGKGLKKTFRSLTKNPIKAIPLAIGVAAAVFTGGSALGLTPSWGEAMTSLSTSVGLTGSAGSIITQAITNAGYGAAIGGIGSVLFGKDATTGATVGGAVGAATGAFQGALGTATPTDSGQIAGANPSAPATGVNTGQTAAMSPWTAAASTTAPAVTGVPSVTPPAQGGLFGLDPNSITLLGGLASGAGQGLMTGQASEDAIKAARARDEAERRWIQGNYSTSGMGLLSPDDVAYLNDQEGANPTPEQRFSPEWMSGDFYYDRETKSLKKKPEAA